MPGLCPGGRGNVQLSSLSARTEAENKLLSHSFRIIVRGNVSNGGSCK